MNRNKFFSLIGLSFISTVFLSAKEKQELMAQRDCNDPITPPVPEGPYYKNEHLNRVDITGNKKGSGLGLFIVKETIYNLKGKIEVESNILNLDTINVIQKDSSQVIFEMNPDIKVSPTMSAQVVNATLKDVTLLDIGHVYVNNLNLKIADSSAVILSGNALKSFHQ